MSKAFSTTESTIERAPPNAVIYDLSKQDQVTITLPARSTWTSGLHWHEKHIEYLRVHQGSVRVTLGGEEHVISAGDEVTEIKVDRNVWHEWRRADVDGGQDVVVVERTDPADGQKAVFFWNLNGRILYAQGLACPPYMSRWLHEFLVGWWTTLSLFAIFRELDNVPVFVDVVRAFSVRGFRFSEGTAGHIILLGIERLISHVVLFVASWVSFLFGVKPVRRVFTPDEVMDRWLSGQERSSSKGSKAR